VSFWRAASSREACRGFPSNVNVAAAVSLAGPYANLLLGSVAALSAWLVPSPVVAAALWLLAFGSYWMAFINVNPLLELDGYYVLIDYFERPNFRPRALAWLGKELLPALRAGRGVRGHWVELLYGIAALLYVALMAVLTVVFYRLILQDWMTRVLPEVVTSGIAWALAAVVVVLATASVIGELRAARAPSPGR